MSSANADDPDRARLAELSLTLREATREALATHSLVAASLDESRSEIDRLLMLESIDDADCRRVVIRAQIMLDAWRSSYGAGGG